MSIRIAKGLMGCVALALLQGACGGGDSMDAQTGSGGGLGAGSGGGGGASAGGSAQGGSAQASGFGPATITVFKIVAGQEKEQRRREFTYDPQGRVTKEESYSLEDGAATTSLSVSSTFTYNADGKTSSSSIRFPSSGALYEHTMTYDGGRRVQDVEIVTRTGGKKETTTEDYTYADGRLVNTQITTSGVTMSRLFKYDSAGRVMSQHFASVVTNQWSDDGWTYDASGRVNEYKTSFKDKDAGSDKYSYDNHGWLNLTEEGTTVENHKLEYVRDDKGLLKEIKSSRLDGTLVQVTRVTMFKGGSAHFWSAASGENYPMNIERAELFGGASANTFDKQ